MKTQVIKEIIDSKLLHISPTINENDWVLLKNGSRTPIFLDTSKFISFPVLLDKLNNLIVEVIKDKAISFNRIIGIPYGGLPFSYGVTSLLKSPGLTIRKEGFKDYSTSGELLGNFEVGDKVLIIEDATVTAHTVIEFVDKIQNKGLVVSDVITILDIEKSAKDNLSKLDISLHALFTWKELYECYNIECPGLITQEMKNFLDKFINE